MTDILAGAALVLIAIVAWSPKTVGKWLADVEREWLRASGRVGSSFTFAHWARSMKPKRLDEAPANPPNQGTSGRRP